jgi:hypothetical protein
VASGDVRWAADHFLVLLVSRWVNWPQLALIDYLLEESRIVGPGLPAASGVAGGQSGPRRSPPGTRGRRAQARVRLGRWLGAACAQLGDAGDATRWLRIAADTGFSCLPWFERNPLLEPLRRGGPYPALIAYVRTRRDSALSPDHR